MTLLHLSPFGLRTDKQILVWGVSDAQHQNPQRNLYSLTQMRFGKERNSDSPGALKSFRTYFVSQSHIIHSVCCPFAQPLLTLSPLLLRLLLRPPFFPPPHLFFLPSRSLHLLLLGPPLLLGPLLQQGVHGGRQRPCGALRGPLGVDWREEGVSGADEEGLGIQGKVKEVGVQHHAIGGVVRSGAVSEVPDDWVAYCAAVDPQLMGSPFTRNKEMIFT